MGRSAAGRFAFIVTIAALALIGRPAAAEPQGFPTKPVRIIVPYTPGSPNDVVARLLAQQLQVKLGQPVVVENKSGGGTTIGSKAAAAAPFTPWAVPGVRLRASTSSRAATRSR